MRTSVHPRTLRSIVDDLQMHVPRASAIRQLRDDVNVLFCGRDERHHFSSCEDLRPFFFEERTFSPKRCSSPGQRQPA